VAFFCTRAPGIVSCISLSPGNSLVSSWGDHVQNQLILTSLKDSTVIWYVHFSMVCLMIVLHEPIWSSVIESVVGFGFYVIIIIIITQDNVYSAAIMT